MTYVRLLVAITVTIAGIALVKHLIGVGFGEVPEPFNYLIAYGFVGCLFGFVGGMYYARWYLVAHGGYTAPQSFD